jgi:hypothetical protein
VHNPPLARPTGYEWRVMQHIRAQPVTRATDGQQ